MNEETESLLQSKGITPTAMRILVLEYLQRQSVAVGLPQLEHDFQHADRTTLYRTLRSFEEKGLVHIIHDGTDTDKYALCAEACRSGNHYDLHLHFYCFACRKTYCLPRHPVAPPDLPGNYQLKELQLLARGTCDQCAG